MKSADAATIRAGIPDATIDLVDRLHRAVDAMAAPIEKANADRLRCRRGCSGCCSDGLTVFEVEAAAIVRKHETLLREAAPHPQGGCAFLDGEGGCRIYAERPYVCRTQGLPLRWLADPPEAGRGSPIEEHDGAAAELRDICPLNAEGTPIESLPADRCWTLGPVEERLADMQAAVDGGALRRVSLRDLFATRAATKRSLPRR